MGEDVQSGGDVAGAAGRGAAPADAAEQGRTYTRNNYARPAAAAGPGSGGAPGQELEARRESRAPAGRDRAGEFTW